MTRKPDSIPLFEIPWDENDIASVADSIKRGGYWAKGPYVDQFESKLEEFLNVNNALVVNSGTTALVAALHGLEIGEDDEVIVPAFTFIATANAVRLVDAEPIFADIESDTYGLSPASVEDNLSESTAAIIPVHPYGTSCRIDELADLAAEHNLALVEDAAEVLGAEFDGQKLGSFGDAAALSFCQNKIVPTGEGGAVVTDDDKLAEQVKLYRSHGRASSDYFESSESGDYAEIGTNIRMSDLTAALGCSQFDRIDELIKRRQQVANELSDHFVDIDGVQPHTPPDAGTHVYQLYTIELAKWINRNHVIETLEDHKISSKVYWDPAVHQTEYYMRTKNDTPDLPVTEDIASRVLSLPMYPTLSTAETDRIADAVIEAVDQ
ncbi:DegT/DnrJ/EryC1/StrS aminotransferase family protein [Halorubrum sp. PV6]|uniref:DegT/DnrJ/EryC1/StrS family aminotransferase n=1 Tax=Halorubrum sp. PV6 TaxID=634157 RepID=UPI000EB74AA0|nr:DegT/DnrJ/EryC1/StrS family aminotransferase [Halorubrum sp. PV6]AYD49517.1 NDP-GlcNAc aminotransferase [Halorubrum sp. PV6]AZQ14279.1 DegT/DnrJ/EryC1/StrS family aminotransferase [Halorubrum sp. PV6]